jgi:hypothetical protein
MSSRKKFSRAESERILAEFEPNLAHTTLFLCRSGCLFAHAADAAAAIWRATEWREELVNLELFPYTSIFMTLFTVNKHRWGNERRLAW